MDDVIAVSAGSGDTLAIGSDGSLWAWNPGRGIFGMNNSDDNEQIMRILTERGWNDTKLFRPFQIWDANTVMLP